MVESILLLDDLRGRLLRHTGGLDRLPEAVWKRTGALNTWGTNAVEGNTLTQAEVEQLLMEARSVMDRPVPDVVETLQHEAAFRSLLQRRKGPLGLITALELHEQVFHGMPAKRPGQWRVGHPFITGTRYRPPRHEKVIPRMTSWAKAYADRDAAKEDVFALGAWMHHEFEAIHPFEDGNGRAGRLLLNLHFLRRDWPPVHVVPEDRDRYLAALEAGHSGDYAPLAQYLRAAMGRSLLDLLDQVGEPEDELCELAAFDGKAWNPYGAHYLGLRARQEALAAVHATHRSAPAATKRRPGKPRWLTSERALRHYIVGSGRSDALRRVRKPRR